MTPLFDDLLGQDRAVALLEASLVKQRLAPAYLFAGPDGVGRRLAALRFLEGVLAGLAGDAGIRRRLQEGNHPDLLWVEPTYQDKGQLVPASKAEELGWRGGLHPSCGLSRFATFRAFYPVGPWKPGAVWWFWRTPRRWPRVQAMPCSKPWRSPVRAC